MRKYYTIYKINKENNDIENIAEFTEREKASEWLQIRLDNFSKYVAKNIDLIQCKLKDDKYFVMIELDN